MKDAPSIKNPVKPPKAVMKDYGGTLGVAPKLVKKRVEEKGFYSNFT